MFMHITRAVFLAQFINTGLLLTLSEASLGSEGIPGFSQMFNKAKYDNFTKGWYDNIGTLIIETMILNAFVPLIV